MKTTILTFLFALGFTFFLQAQFDGNQGLKPQVIPGQYIVELKAKPVILTSKRGNNREANVNQSKSARQQLAELNRSVQASARISKEAVLNQYQDAMVGFAAKLSRSQVEMLRQNPNVMGVYPDYTVALGPIKFEKPIKPIIPNRQTVSCAVEQAGGPAKGGAAKPTWIWILDTGIDLNHPDLNVQTHPVFAKSFIPGQTPEDGHGHGTHVAGIAGAKNNFFGSVGVSAGAKVVPVKVLSNSGTGPWSGIIAGLDHVAMYDIPGDVVNMSLGGYGYTDCENANPTLRNVVRNLGNAGVWVVMAAGNDSADANRNLPGCINGNRVYTVGALNCDYSCAGYSNWGSAVDWAAVGTGVYSTHKNGGYTTMSGTSMATPVVAGIIHARGAAPLSAGNVNCSGRNYRIARR